MASEYGAHMEGPNLVLRPNTASSGVIVTEGKPIEQLLVKTHSGYTSSGALEKTFVVSTTDNTATIIASIPVPSGYAISVRFHVLGMQDDMTDASTYTGICCATNNAGTSALKGTALYQVVESNASCDCAAVINDTTDTIDIKVTGITSENYAWICQAQILTVKTSA